MLRFPAMTTTSVFGNPSSSKTAQAIMDSASLNKTPSPSEPKKVPADGVSKQYAAIYSIASKLLIDDTDPSRLMELQRIVSFCDRAMSEEAAAIGSGGAPVPDVQTPPPPPPPAPPPVPAPAGPQAAPGGPAPGGPLGPLLSGAPGA